MNKMKFFEICALGILVTSFSAQAQIIPSGATVVQGTELPNRGNAVNVVMTDGAGNIISAAGTPTGPAGTPNANVVTVQGIAGGVAQPVSAAALPLPTGAATETTLGTFSSATHADLIAATPAGSNIIGKVGIDQTTPGTTNAVVTTGNVASAATDSGNPVKVGGVFTTALPTFTTGQRGDLQLTAKGQVYVTIASSAIVAAGDATSNSSMLKPSDSAGTGGYLASWPYLYNGSTWDRAKKPNLACRIVSAAATTNATSCKVTAGDVFAFEAYNASATVKYLKIYNKASAPTVGTDTPILTIALPPTSRTTMAYASPHYFSLGIAIALTGAVADADTTALTAADVVALNVSYQ